MPIDSFEITIVVLAILPSLAALAAAFVTFDKLVRLEYRCYRGAWEADGQPHGFFWIPGEVVRWGGWIVSARSSIASRRCAIAWLLSTPDWVRNDPDAKRLLLWMRVMVGFWNLNILLVLLLVLSK